MAEGEVQSGSKRAPLVFLLAVIAYIGASYWNAALIPDYSSADRVFPIFVATIGLIGAMILFVQMMIKPETHPLFSDREAQEADLNVYGLWQTLVWFAGLLLLTALAGFIIALTVFLFTFMLVRAQKSVGFAALYTAAGIAFICFMASLLNRDFPPGLLQSVTDMPWPLR